jgi:hypothetical protein
MEHATCTERITSIDEQFFCVPSIQWKFPLRTWKYLHCRLWFHEFFWSIAGMNQNHFLQIIILPCCLTELYLVLVLTELLSVLVLTGLHSTLMLT